MTATLLKAFAYVFIILLTYVLKKRGFFKTEDKRIVTFIVMNITFPAAIVTNFSTLDLDFTLFSIVLIGSLSNFAMLLFANLFFRKRSIGERGLLLLSTSGYNIGTFTMPFIQSIIGPFGAGIVGLFDIGNAAMVTGGSYAAASRMLHQEKKISLYPTLAILSKSAPFLTYIVLLILAGIKFKIPGSLLTFIAPISAANSFLAMLMIGLFLEIKINRSTIKIISTILTMRLIGSTLLSVAFYYLLPFSLEIRQILILILFSPLSVMTPIFTQKIKGDSALASLLTSLSVITSLIIMTGLMIAMQIGT